MAILLNWYLLMVARLSDEEEGQGLVEYALIIALVSVLLIAALTGMKDQIVLVFGKIVTALK